jgi:hypothetical protein
MRSRALRCMSFQERPGITRHFLFGELELLLPVWVCAIHASTYPFALGAEAAVLAAVIAVSAIRISRTTATLRRLLIAVVATLGAGAAIAAINILANVLVWVRFGEMNSGHGAPFW